MKYRKKPVVIEAFLFDVETCSIKEIHDFCEKNGLPKFSARCIDGVCGAGIDTLEGTHLCRKGDWIVKGVKGEFYPCKPDIFKLTYDKV